MTGTMQKMTKKTKITGLNVFFFFFNFKLIEKVFHGYLTVKSVEKYFFLKGNWKLGVACLFFCLRHQCYAEVVSWMKHVKLQQLQTCEPCSLRHGWIIIRFRSMFFVFLNHLIQGLTTLKLLWFRKVLTVEYFCKTPSEIVKVYTFLLQAKTLVVFAHNLIII